MNCKKCSTCGVWPEFGGYSVSPKGTEDFTPIKMITCPKCGKQVIGQDYTVLREQWDAINDPHCLQIKLLDPACRPTRSGNWIDCYSREEIHYEAGECKRIPLGFCVSVGKGKEMLLAARSSFFGKTGGIQTNAPGVIDEEYCGDEDEVLFSVYFTRPGVIHKGQKIAQFRIVDKMPEVKFEYVEKMEAPSRGGFGSTGN